MPFYEYFKPRLTQIVLATRGESNLTSRIGTSGLIYLGRVSIRRLLVSRRRPHAYRVFVISPPSSSFIHSRAHLLSRVFSPALIARPFLSLLLALSPLSFSFCLTHARPHMYLPSLVFTLSLAFTLSLRVFASRWRFISRSVTRRSARFVDRLAGNSRRNDL